MTLKNVRLFSRFHPRCGTSFLFLVLLISIFVYSFLPDPWWVKLAGRVVLLPIIGGISYEFIKLSGRFPSNPVIKVITAPGLWLQRITTKEPSNKQIEVGIKALKAVVD